MIYEINASETDSYLLHTFVQVIQIVSFIALDNICLIELIDVILEVSPYTLHSAEIKSNWSGKFALYGGIADLFQSFVGFLA